MLGFVGIILLFTTYIILGFLIVIIAGLIILTNVYPSTSQSPNQPDINEQRVVLAKPPRMKLTEVIFKKCKISAKIVYKDTKGIVSTRSIKIQKIGNYNSTIAIKAYDLSVKASRTFLASGIQSMVDTDTGEYISNITDFLTKLL